MVREHLRQDFRINPQLFYGHANNHHDATEVLEYILSQAVVTDQDVVNAHMHFATQVQNCPCGWSHIVDDGAPLQLFTVALFFFE